MNAARLREYVQVYNIDMDCSVVAVDGNEILGLAMLGLEKNEPGLLAWVLFGASVAREPTLVW